MLLFLARRWFLLLVVLGCTLAWLAPDWLRWTRFADAQVAMAVSLFLTAWTLESRSLLRTILRPGPALWTVAISYGLLPAVAWLLGDLLLGRPDLRVGLMITASVPCTLSSAVLWTRMAGGNEASALLSTMLTTGTSWLATTAWLALTTHSEASVDALGMMHGLLLVLVVPLLVGQLCRAAPLLARTATRYKGALSVLARLLVVVIMLRAAIQVSDRLGDEGAALGWTGFLLTAAVCLGTHLLSLAVGFWSGKLLGFDLPDRIAVAFGGSQKTLPVSLYLFETYFRAFPLAVVPMVCFHIGQLVIDTFIADTLIRRGEKEKTQSQGAGLGEEEVMSQEGLP